MPVRISIPPVTRALLIAVLSVTFLHGLVIFQQVDSVPEAARAAPYLALVPGEFWLYPWTLVTASLVESNLFTVLITGPTIFYGGKYLERAWGSRELAKFIFVVTMIPNLVLAILLAVASVLTKSSVIYKEIHGGVGILSAFLVPFKQLVPEHTVTLLRGVVKIRVKHFPALFLLMNAASALILGTYVAFSLSWLGLLASWTYLRFYKRSPDVSASTSQNLTIRGDASETFAFTYFFPDAIQPAVSFFSGIIYSLFVNLHICVPFSAEDIALGNEQAMERDTGLPNLASDHDRSARGSGKREEAERRRALALRALDQRLQAASASRSAPLVPSSPSSSTRMSPQPLAQTESQARPPTSVIPSGAMLNRTDYRPNGS